MTGSRCGEAVTETELYKELGALTKDKTRWEGEIPHVSSLLATESVKIRAKALWLLGEMGLRFPASIGNHVPRIASFLDNEDPLLRERAVIALGRIGRGDYRLIEPYWAALFRFARDKGAKVRLGFIWASENIATNTPDPYGDFMPVFAELLHDENDKVRMEAPEIFRVLGRCKPEFVTPYMEQLRLISETDGNRVVRIHCSGAIKAATRTAKTKSPSPIERAKGHAPKTAGDYSGLKSDLETPQTGQTQSSGTSSQAVPGAIPLSGSPTAGS